MAQDDISPLATFAAFGSDEEAVAKADVEGEKLWNMLFKRDLNFGGHLVGGFGVMGSGKTSLLHVLKDRVISDNKEEVCFWREPVGNPLQAINGVCAVDLYAEEAFPVKLMKMTDKGLQPSSSLKIQTFDRLRVLRDLVRPGRVSVVYMKERFKWIKLIDLMKITQGWQSFFFDEFEDIVPLRVSGRDWAENERFANSMKDIRKSYVSIYYNTQNQQDIDYRITSKTMVHIYLYGARRDDYSPVFKQALQGLELGTAWIDFARARYGKFRFKAVRPRFPLHYVVADKDDDEAFDEDS